MFRDEQERQRAREAAVNVMGPHAYVSDEYLGLEFDRLYPPVVDAPDAMKNPLRGGRMPDYTQEPDAPPMPSDAAFREALDAILELVENHSYAYSERDAMYARVIALYAERQGEVIADFIAPVQPDSDFPSVVSILLGPTVKPGDRVRVTKVEEGT